MYLNIVNNLSFDNKKRKSFPIKKESEDSGEEVSKPQNLYECYAEVYNSLFYGQLTQNWLKFKN